MKTFGYLLIVAALQALSSCDEENGNQTEFCHVASLEELEWLRDEINSEWRNTSATMDIRVYSANYLGMEVVYLDFCCVNCLVTPPKVRTCQGTDLGFLGSEVDENLVINRKVVWRTQNGFCE